MLIPQELQLSHRNLIKGKYITNDAGAIATIFTPFQILREFVSRR